MKIFFIGQKGIPGVSGGVEKHVEDLSTRLVTAGQEVYVYTRPNYTDKTLKKYKGVNLISLPSVPTKHLDAISHTFFACLDLIFRRREADIVHFHSIGPSSLIWLIRILRPKVRIVFTFHSKCYNHQKWGVFARLYLRLSEYLACHLADQIIVVSKSLQNYVEEKYGLVSVYIPNGTCVSEKLKPVMIKKWGLEKGNYILSVSRLVRVKGLHKLIKAYNALETNKKLVIVGGGEKDKEYEEELKKLAANNSNIIFTGRLSGNILKELYSNAYLFVQASESEGLSVSLLEAMSYGINILSSDIKENIEATNGKGNVFESFSEASLERQLKNILSSSNNQFSDYYIKRVKTEYNWNDIARKTVGIYQAT